MEHDARRHLERTAQLLFAVAALSMAIICGAVIVSGWFAGVIQDQYERVFWAGATLGAIMVAVFAIGAVPGGSDDQRTITRIRWATRIGLILFVVAPALCVGSLVADFFL